MFTLGRQIGIHGERRLVMRDFPLTPSQRRRLEEQLRATEDAGVFRRTLAVLEAAGGRPVSRLERDLHLRGQEPRACEPVPRLVGQGAANPRGG